MKLMPLAVLLTLLAVPSPAATARQPLDAETERVTLIETLERSVAVIMVSAREVRHLRTNVIVDEQPAIGSGVLLTADGVVLTAAHVVSDATEVSVRFYTGDEQQVDVIFSDDAADLALLRVPVVPAGAQPATLGNSDLVRKGQTVYVLGNPIGVEFSLSAGIVSGRHAVRHLFGGDAEAEMIQTDAAMNAGNSGGPMFNGRGEVIAIAQRILTSGGGSEGLGFGVAVNAVRKLLTGDPCLWLGFSAVALDGEWSAALNVPQSDALLVQSVAPRSPAARAGLRGGSVPVQSGNDHLLRGGDVILEVDKTPISLWRRQPWQDTAEGTPHHLVVSVLRGGRTIDITIETIHHNSLLHALAH